MSFADRTGRLLRPAERLLAALADPARRERVVLAVLAGYVAVWTLYGVIAKASQDIHFDMAELAAWAREPAFGYPKHPPFAAWLARSWFAIFPTTDWAYYLLAVTVVAIALWVAWQLFGRYLDGEKRVVALAMLTLIPLFNFHALKFNPNTVLIPLWAITTLWFIRSYETRSSIAAALAGVGAAACMLGKYWSIFLLLGLGIAALIDARRGEYFRSAAPWITIAAGALVLAPHVAWLFAHDFIPFSYAVAAHGTSSIVSLVERALGYLAGGAGYIALPVLLVLAVIRPSGVALAEALKPKAPERRLAAAAFWAPLLIPAVLAPLFGIEINSIWTMSAWTLLPVVLLGSPRLEVARSAAVRIIAVAIAVPFVLLATSPLIAGAIHRAGVLPAAAHYKLLADHVAQGWRAATDRPLQYVGGDASLSYGVAFYVALYLADRPSTFPDLDPRIAPWIDQRRLARTGIALVCATADRGCVAKVEARAGAAGRRGEVELSRRYFGIAGVPARYLIIIVPPRAE